MKEEGELRAWTALEGPERPTLGVSSQHLPTSALLRINPPLSGPHGYIRAVWLCYPATDSGLRAGPLSPADQPSLFPRNLKLNPVYIARILSVNPFFCLSGFQVGFRYFPPKESLSQQVINESVGVFRGQESKALSVGGRGVFRLFCWRRKCS